MVALCENGWPVCFIDDTELIKAGGRQWRFCSGDVAYIFKVFITRYAQEVEPIDHGVLDDWSFIKRNVRDSDTEISNHAGYACDINALRHLRGVPSKLNKVQLSALRRLLTDFWIIRWGGDYRVAIVDPMHFEIKPGVTKAQVAAFANALKHNTPVGPSAQPASTPVNPGSVKVTPAVAPTKVPLQAVRAPQYPLPKGSYFGPKEGPKNSVSGYYSHQDHLKMWQQRMSARGWNINTDGYYTRQTQLVVIAFEKDKKLTVDEGHIGPQVWRAAWEAPVTKGLTSV